MVGFVDLPLEIVFDILGWVSPNDLVSMRQVSQRFNKDIRDNVQLARAVYCNYFDVPPTTDLAWQQELDDFVRLQSICASDNPNKTTELPFVYRTVKRLLANSARIKNGDTDTLFHHRPFRNIEHLSRMLNTPINQAAFFCRSYVFDRMRHVWKSRVENEADYMLTARRRKHRSNRRQVAEFRESGNVSSDTDEEDERNRVNNRNRAAPPVMCKPHEVNERSQMSAELHCLLGTVLLRYPHSPKYYESVYRYAMTQAYDRRQYPEFRPFLPGDQREVNWEQLEVLLIVLRHSVRERKLLHFPIISKYWNNTFLGSSPGSYLPLMTRNMVWDAPNRGPASALDSQEDPYGVSGTWMQLVCFLDHGDLEYLNKDFPDEMPYPPPREDENVYQDMRLVLMKMHITKIDPPAERDHPDYPVVYFEGVSHPLNNPWRTNVDLGVRGCVSTTRQGQVHWTTFTIVNSRVRWHSESIQIGGHLSGRGVVGSWFTADHNRQGLCGSAAFWKLDDKIVADTTPCRPIKAFSQLLSSPVGTDGINVAMRVTQPFVRYVMGEADRIEVEDPYYDYRFGYSSDDDYHEYYYRHGENWLPCYNHVLETWYDRYWSRRRSGDPDAADHDLAFPDAGEFNGDAPVGVGAADHDDDGDDDDEKEADKQKQILHEYAQERPGFVHLCREIETHMHQQIHDDAHFVGYSIMDSEHLSGSDSDVDDFEDVDASDDDVWPEPFDTLERGPR